MFFQGEFAFLFLARHGGGGNGIDSAIHTHVADLHFVRGAVRVFALKTYLHSHAKLTGLPLPTMLAASHA